MAHFHNNALIGASGQGGYLINQSLRFNWADSTRLYRTFGSNNSNANFTVSFWCKRAALNEYNAFLAAQVNASNYEHWMFYNDNAIGTSNGAGGVATDHKSTALFRDPSAWYHVVWKNVASGSTTVYVNNTQMLSFTRGTKAVNGNYNHNIGVGSDSGSFGANFYLAEYHLVDGSALEPSSFAETDTITGAWIPKKYSGSYGTNGAYLKFDPSATNGIGHDHSGNGNNFTATGFSTSGTGTDVMSDTPTNNWCTLNPLEKGSVVTLSNGNLDYSFGSASQRVHGTVGVSSGKWYWEETKNSGTYGAVGISLNVAPTTFTGNDAYSWSYNKNGNKYHNGTGVAYGATWDSGDTIGVAFDADAGSLEFYKNGTSQGTAYSSIPTGNTYFPACGDWGVNGTVNFGQRAFAYTPPTGFKALSTGNLPEPTIKKGSKYFDTKLYTANNQTAQTITGLGFSPDLLWFKPRSRAEHHYLYDQVRGAGNRVSSSQTIAEVTGDNSLTAFTSDGFSLGTDGAGIVNYGTDSMVAWAWDANGAGSSNTAGSITSTVSANATAGFSIVTYTGTGTAGTVGHGLGVAPRFVIVRKRSGGTMGGGYSDWLVYSQAAVDAGAGSDAFLYLNTTGATSNSSSVFGSAPTSTIFNIGNNQIINNSSSLFVAYCFSEVAGYSKFGSYTGNGSSDGPFVFCGFRPRWVLVKAYGNTGSWNLLDTARDTYNEAYRALQPNASNSEAPSGYNNMDILSNGFKIRVSDTGVNRSSTGFIFAAFAELPAKYSNAR